jgi:excisionase family DNA binding protein
VQHKPSTIHVDPAREDAKDILDQLMQVARELLAAGRPFQVAFSAGDALLSPNQAAERLGFSRQHVMRLVESNRLEARRLSPDSRYWKIPAVSVAAFEQQRDAAIKRADASSRELDSLGAPLE